MLALFKDRIFLLYIILFGLSAWVLRNQYPMEDLFTGSVILGIIFPMLSWLISRNAKPLYRDKPLQWREPVVLLFVIVYITIWLTWGTGWVSRNTPAVIRDNAQAKYIFDIIKKLIVFVIIPCWIYHLKYGFNLKDFGAGFSIREMASKKSLIILAGAGIPLLLFQYYLGGGAAPIREGKFSASQMLIGFPLLFISLVIEVGLVEEFFFRALLQSRLTVWLRSPRAAILVSGLIFGLAHVPGLWLRGASSLEGLSPDAGIDAILAVAIVNLSIAGIFMGIIWHYTRNLWLIMFIHALVDLLPNFGEFVKLFNL
jgi:membrane protease YdiL (CAAX protease family)